VVKPYKIRKLQKMYDYFPPSLIINGKPWTRDEIRCDKFWAGKRAELINNGGLYKARLVSMLVTRGVDAGRLCYAVYTYAIMPRKKRGKKS